MSEDIDGFVNAAQAMNIMQSRIVLLDRQLAAAVECITATIDEAHCLCGLCANKLNDTLTRIKEMQP